MVVVSQSPLASTAVKNRSTQWRSPQGERKLPNGLQAWLPRVLPELAELVKLAPEALTGDSATHSDLRPDNILIDNDGACWTIDWNWLTLGPRS